MADAIFNPERLTTARQRRRLRRVELASAIGVTPRSISLFENDGKEPAAETMEKIVEVLGFRREFYFQPSIGVPNDEQASFRATTTLTSKDRDQGLAAAVLAHDLMKVIREDFEVPHVDIPDLSEHPPEVAADMLRVAWNLGDGPLPNMMELLESRGVRIFSIGADGAKLDAYAVWLEDQPFVMMALPYLDDGTVRKSPEAQRFTLAHELGHLVLHRDGRPPQGRQAENEANAFAANFLMPSASVRRQVSSMSFRGFVVDDVLDLKASWLVSLSAFVKRLHTLGMISDWQYKDAFIDMSTRGWLKCEASPKMTTPESSQIVEAFSMMLIGERRWNDVAGHLGWTVDDLDGMLFKRLPRVLTGGAGVGVGGGDPPTRSRPKLALVR